MGGEGGGGRDGGGRPEVGDGAGDLAPMSAEDLEEIGTRIYGRWGWPVKLGRAIGRDASTLRRWRGGAPIEPAMARAVREHARRFGAGPSWDAAHGGADRADADAPFVAGPAALRALRAVARAQEIGALGAPVAARVFAEPPPGGVRVVLRAPGREPLEWRSDGDPGALAAIEAALEAAWPST